jgi:hypothetical protein
LSRRTFSEDGARRQDRIVYASLIAVATMLILELPILLFRFIAC